MLADADILFGKLALGRRCITREDAKRLAHEVASARQQGRQESLSQTAVRLGYIAPAQAQSLTQVLEHGSLICRGTCGRTFKLSGLTPQDTTACPDCRGHLYVAKLEPAAAVATPVSGSGDEGGGGMTVMDLEFDAVDMGGPGRPPDPTPAPAPDPGEALEDAAGKTFLDLDLDMPSSGGVDPGASTPHPPAPTLDQPTPRGDAGRQQTTVGSAAAFDPLTQSDASGRDSAPPDRTMVFEDDFEEEVKAARREAAAPDQTMLFEDEDDAAAPGGTIVLDPASNPAAEVRAAAADPDAAPGGTILLEPGSVDGFDVEGAEQTVEMDGFQLGGGAAFEPFSIAPGLEVVAPVGQGGMGSVYRGRRASGELVAVKVLTQGGAHLPEVLERFRREVKLCSGLHHPHIVRVYEAGLAGPGEHEGRPYFVMDFVAGRDLGTWAREQRRSPADLIQVVLPVCDAIHYAHGRGVVHRDLKPGNILVTHQGDRPIVCDFGLAKVASAAQRLTRTGDILGTPNYMPPEQALGKRTQIGPPTDVYALGAILFFLLTGRPPYTGPTAFSVIDKLVKSPLEPPSALGVQVPPALEQVVVKALAKEPVQRFHTCDQLAQALRAAA